MLFVCQIGIEYARKVGVLMGGDVFVQSTCDSRRPESESQFPVLCGVGVVGVCPGQDVGMGWESQSPGLTGVINPRCF